MKIAFSPVANATKVGRLFGAISRKELTDALARMKLKLPSYTKLATDTVLYPSNSLLGYDAKLAVEPGLKGFLSIRRAQTQGTSTSSFHRVELSRTGDATYYPNSFSGGPLRPASDGSMQLQEILSEGIEVPKAAKKDVILLATPSRKGDLLDVLTRKASGTVKMTSYALVGSTLNKLTGGQAEQLRLENVFRPSFGGLSEGLSVDEWARTIPAEPAKPTFTRAVQRPLSAPVVAPARQPAVERQVFRSNPDEFWTVDPNPGGTFTAYSGSKRSGIATGQRSFNTRNEADAFIRENNGERLLFVNGDRNAPVFK